jgi:hypothetical protein
MDIRKTTAAYPVIVPQRRRMEPVETADSGAARSTDPVERASGRGPLARTEPVFRVEEGSPERRADDDAARAQRQQAVLNARAQQALKAYLNQETFAEQESRAALSQVLGVDYYA